MKAFKVIGFGLLFSFIGTIGYLLFGLLVAVVRGPSSTSHATAISAITGGLTQATIFNPLYWIIIVAAFGVAFWVVTRKRHA